MPFCVGMNTKRSEPHDAAAISVLVVDRQPFFRLGIRRALQPHRWLKVVDEAATSEDALSKANALQPAVVLLDDSLLGSEAPDAIRRLRQESGGCKVIVITHLDPAAETTARRVNPVPFADACLPKTAAAAELLSLIQAVAQSLPRTCPLRIPVLL